MVRNQLPAQVVNIINTINLQKKRKKIKKIENEQVTTFSNPSVAILYNLSVRTCVLG